MNTPVQYSTNTTTTHAEYMQYTRIEEAQEEVELRTVKSACNTLCIMCVLWAYSCCIGGVLEDEKNKMYSIRIYDVFYSYSSCIRMQNTRACIPYVFFVYFRCIMQRIGGPIIHQEYVHNTQEYSVLRGKKTKREGKTSPIPYGTAPIGRNAPD